MKDMITGTLGLKVVKDEQRGMVGLEFEGRIIEFGGIPAIQSFAQDNPGVPERIINELLAREGGYTGFRYPEKGGVVANHSGYGRPVLFAANEDEGWKKAAEESVKQFEINEASKRCTLLSQELNKRYPDAGLSFGYIGNLGPQLDDRSWRFFTKIEVGTGNHRSRVYFGGYGTDDLPKLADRAEKGLENFLHQNLSLASLGANSGNERFWRNALNELSPVQQIAICDFRETHGRQWKSKLHAGWLVAKWPGPLQQVRNSFGPEWLQRVKESDFAPTVRVIRCEEANLGVLRGLGAECGTFDHARGVVEAKVTPKVLAKLKEFAADFKVVEEAACPGFGVRKGRDGDGLAYQESLRSEWEP